jgi:hypothetical protein
MPRINANYYNRGIPAECDAKMESHLGAGQRMVCVAFPPQGGNSWSVITDKTFFNRNIPDECHDKMNELDDAGHKILWVAFPPKGGNSWSVITDKTFFSRHIPDDCHDKMKEMDAAGHKPRCVAFPKTGDHPLDLSLSGNRWSLIAGSRFFNRDIPDLCHRRMRAMTGCGMGPLRVVAFPPGGGFALIARADALYAPDPVLTAGGKSSRLRRSLTACACSCRGRAANTGWSPGSAPPFAQRPTGLREPA